MNFPLRQLLFPLAFWLAAGCATRSDDITIEGPGLPTGPGIVYPVKDVTFTTVDSVQVSARYGHPTGSGPNPVVILVHDIGEISTFYRRARMVGRRFVRTAPRRGIRPACH